MSQGMNLSVKIKEITAGPQSGSYGMEIHDPRLDSDRPAQTTARMRGIFTGKRLVWRPMDDGTHDQPEPISISQFYWPDP